MKRFPTIAWVSLTAVLCLLLSAIPVFSEEGPGESDRVLLDLINQARANPLAVAASLGMDREKILADFPAMKRALTEGLPALKWSDALYQAAAGHTADMFARGYYGHDAPAQETDAGKPPPGSPWHPEEEWVTYPERIVESGYEPALSGESLGFLWFTNYIDSEMAASFIFEAMFRNELDPAFDDERNILNPDLREAGASVQAGNFVVSGYRVNAYIATVDFGGREVHVIEQELLGLINQARANPLAMAATLGLDPDQVLQDLPEMADILAYGLPPLLFHPLLYGSADAHAQDMLGNWYFSYFSLDGSGPWDRIADAGYGALFTGESIGLTASLCGVALKEVAGQLFKASFLEELSPDYALQRNILGPELTEAGIAFAGYSLCGTDEFSYTYDLWVADFAAPAEREETGEGVVTGVVFEDVDGNGLYGIGEGLSGISVTIASPDDGAALAVTTDIAGGFAVQLGSGAWQIWVTLGDKTWVREIDLAPGVAISVQIEVSAGV